MGLVEAISEPLLSPLLSVVLSLPELVVFLVLFCETRWARVVVGGPITAAVGNLGMWDATRPGIGVATCTSDIRLRFLMAGVCGDFCCSPDVFSLSVWLFCEPEPSNISVVVSSEVIVVSSWLETSSPILLLFLLLDLWPLCALEIMGVS